MLSDDRNRQQEFELDAAFARFLDLCYADQLEFAKRLARFLETKNVKTPLLDDEDEKQRRSLDCIRRAQRHLGLARPPTVNAYREAARELGLEFSAQQIQRLWGRWLNATGALTSGRKNMTAAERTFRSAH
jgi:hypothetical protein